MKMYKPKDVRSLFEKYYFLFNDIEFVTYDENNPKIMYVISNRILKYSFNKHNKKLTRKILEMK